ncbi:iron ABC transporter permease [Sphaerochaeta sp. S2]|uniref:ABC transporter permease n=1 Tax=Sphaerochaeta sp. S2 TaxID=2798868 RepID=UPI0018E9B216|nr:iron ABC transporter permease [Sphaerochaeta sp. S2]MBJ2357828.1 iron ABC transporter permease [Sphaerochaeta sp. S2]
MHKREPDDTLGGIRIQQFIRKQRKGLFNPTIVLGIVLALILTYLIAIPVLMLITESVQVHSIDAGYFQEEVGSFTLRYFERALVSKVASVLFLNPLINTLLIAVFITFFATIIGYLLAWIITRTDIHFKRIFATLAVVPFMLPSWSYAAAWITLFKNRKQAGAPGILEVMGFTIPDALAYGPIPIIICLSMHYFPLAFLMFGNAFQRIDSQMEESAQIVGANKLQTAVHILLPVMKPAIMSSILLTFARSVGTFGTPYTLGRPVRFNTLSTSLYFTYQSGEPGVMAVTAVAMLLIGALLVATDVYILREYKRYVTMGGKGQMSRPFTLGSFQIPLNFLVGFFLFTVIVLPLGILALSTLMVTPGWFVKDNFTLQFWFAEETRVREAVPGLLRDPQLLSVAWTSVKVAGIGALICGTLGTLVGYAVVRLQQYKLSKYLRHLSFLPYLVPGIGFGAAYLVLFATGRGPIPALYGTLLLMILAMSVMYLPLTTRSSISSMAQMGSEPEEAAMILGAGWLTRMFRIVIPIQKRSLFSGILLAFIQGMKELSLVIMLAVPGLEVLTTLSIRYTDNALLQMSNGVILLIAFITFLLTAISQRLTKTNLAEGIGG